MKLSLTCEACGLVAQYDATSFSIDYEASVPCDGCSLPINIPTETITLEEKLKEPNAYVELVLEKGELVRFNNSDHVWHNEIALICDRKPLFYRLEVRGKRIWVPTNWVTKL
jgi:hypothetical protein